MKPGSTRPRLIALVGRTEVLEELIAQTDVELGVKYARRTVNMNITEKKLAKLDKSKYPEFLRTVRFPPDIGYRLLGSRLVNRFFAPEEIERMETRWL